MSNELKPCPFCGASMYGKHSENCYLIMACEEMRSTWLEFPLYTESERQEAWNTRYVDGDTSDGYHTFNELYHHRAVLFSKVVQFAGGRAWKSKLHADGTMYEGYFIVGVETPEGQATYHYSIDPYWEMFDCKEVEQAPVWDGHTPQEAIGRIERWNQRAERTCELHGVQEDYPCLTFEVSLSCGHDVYITNPDLAKYCPVCGARVVGD